MLLRLVDALGPPLVRALGSTLRFRLIPEGVEEARRRSGQQAIFAFWHGRMLVPAFTHRHKKIAILVSRHQDGEFIARVVKKLGFVAPRGSTTRGGVGALKSVLRAVRAGHDIAFTPDGPRGPRYKVQNGVVFIASRTGLPLVPVGVEVSKAWVLGSWDEFTIPKPFARAVMLQGDPIHVPPGIEGDELERWRRTVEREMHRLMADAKRIACETSGPGRR